MALAEGEAAALAQLRRKLVHEQEELAESKAALANSWLAFEADLAEGKVTLAEGKADLAKSSAVLARSWLTFEADQAALAEGRAALAEGQAALAQDRAELEAHREEGMLYFRGLFANVYLYAMWFASREADLKKVEARLTRYLYILCPILFASFVAFAMSAAGLYCYRYLETRK